MRYVAIAIVIAFLSIGTFGFAILEHEVGVHESGCVAASISEAPCPSELFASALYHISTLTAFSTVPLSLPLLLFIALALIALVHTKGIELPRLRPLFSRRTVTDDQPRPSRSALRSLALLEHSPTFA
ncbi:MAG: hypothetical protein HYS26_01825 [Candidatus Kaiserbacteria bacterium]|nr:MAG: hypothetical protein HYS26_01825 [Candidatus Kaiserbacteria bacterium]